MIQKIVLFSLLVVHMTLGSNQPKETKNVMYFGSGAQMSWVNAVKVKRVSVIIGFLGENIF